MGLYLGAMEIDNTNISKDGHLKLGQPVHISLKTLPARWTTLPTENISDD